MELKNRIAFPPVTTCLAGADGSISKEGIDYYEARARGGAALICTEACYPGRNFPTKLNLLHLSSPRSKVQLSKLAEAIHAYDAKLCLQISAGWGRVMMLSGKPDEIPLSSSPTPCLYDPGIRCRELTVQEIGQLTDDLAELVGKAALCGVDAINIHAHNGYLIDQFMSPQWNKRIDEYGGSLEKRLAFPMEIIRKMRATLGTCVPIIFRISLDQMIKGGNTLDDSIKMLSILEKQTSVNAFDVDIAVYERVDYMFPPYYYGDAPYRHVASACKKAGITLPVLNAGSHTPETALATIENRDADVVMFARPLLADPDLPNKLLYGMRTAIRPCIRCNDYCLGNELKGVSIGCAVNAQTGNEFRNRISPAGKAQKVVIVGGGPGGLEAARVAALKGYAVSLYEKRSSLGGMITAAATPPFKRQLREYIEWAIAQVQALGVEIRLEKEISADSFELSNADAIIVAIGSLEVLPPIPGIDGATVVGVVKAHLQPDLVKGENIVVAGGGLSGCDLALELAMTGKKVTIVEMADQIAREILFLNAMALKNKLDQHGVTVLTSHTVRRIDDQGVHMAAAGKDIFLQADTIVTAFGCKPNTEPARAIRNAYPHKTRLVGDCSKVAKVGEAIRSGFFAAKGLETI
jgi:2,4-dienoyl-CoA reductase-like NADH-dependent reductase (Old Yellow Enzyme family)/thioredoxin reductase